jgi:hypothetical protein
MAKLGVFNGDICIKNRFFMLAGYRLAAFCGGNIKRYMHKMRVHEWLLW